MFFLSDELAVGSCTASFFDRAGNLWLDVRMNTNWVVRMSFQKGLSEEDLFPFLRHPFSVAPSSSCFGVASLVVSQIDR